MNGTTKKMIKTVDRKYLQKEGHVAGFGEKYDDKDDDKENDKEDD